MTDPERPRFPRGDMPQDPAAAGLIGLYPQRQAGLWMQRVKVPSGALTGAQWRGLGASARDFTPDAPLHLTTRQDVELHDLPEQLIPACQSRLAELGLTGLGAGGDSVRNITVCPCSGLRAGAVDLSVLAKEVRRTLESRPDVFRLPRKFKISLSGCQAGCGGPWVNDLGLVVRRRDGVWGFSVTAGGSLGPRPGLGMLLLDWLAADDALPLVWAVVNVFAAQGNRQDRRRARLRHVREKIGEQAFRELVLGEMAQAKACKSWPVVPLDEVVDGHTERIALTFRDGNIAPEAAEAMAEAAARSDLALRIATHHQVIMFARDKGSAQRFLQTMPALRAAAQPQPNVVACPGRRWCVKALVDTHKLAGMVRESLPGDGLADITVAISGCPNGCAHSAIADVGVIGAIKREGDAASEAFDVLTGGGMGRAPVLARLAGRRLSARQAVEQIGRLLSQLVAERSGSPPRTVILPAHAQSRALEDGDKAN
jgi:sulfite reductase beta subunit-like hemoprotein